MPTPLPLLLPSSPASEKAPQARPLRVCLVNEFFWPDSTGGTGTVLSELVRTLRARHGSDIDLDVITSRNLYRSAAGGHATELPLNDEWNGVPIRRIPCPSAVGKRPLPRLIANLRFGTGALRALLAAHRRRHYDLLVIATAPPTLATLASLFRRLTGTPYLYIIYDLDPDRAVVMHLLTEHSPIAQVLRFLQRRWLHHAKRVVVLGRCMREYLTARYDLPPQQIEVIPIGSDPEEIRPLPQAASAFRREQGLGDAFVVLYSGNFGRYHNFDTILDAAKLLADASPSVRFVLAGGGAQRQHVEQRVAEERIGNVQLLPFVERDRYADMLAAADVSLVTLEPGMEGLCVPSKFYSLLAAGRAVIGLMGEECEVARVLAEEHCGLRVDSADSSALADAITDLVKHPAQVARMGEQGRAALERRFSCNQVADLYAEALFTAASRLKPTSLTALTNLTVGEAVEESTVVNVV